MTFVDSIQFLANEVLDPNQLGKLWDEIVLTPEEGRAVEALQVVEPSIERIAVGHGGDGSKYSFFLKLAGSSERVPLGSMGDGTKRLLALALHLARASGGVLLVDEIDTGLHYSVMLRMWRLVIETARRLGVQVFATTHSLDCINALAELCERSPDLGREILLHRIEPGQETAMTYTAEELRIAAEQHMEVR
ncbi:AAA family ATPase [Polyangium aurulentum]|uniref:AAA family ATPase n=1 Tax=Polyangium aurulentum TaxID=2567896 RepID=UPI001F3E7FAA|nr:AAA family ATPase [Polyangium aurulentum]